jgi:hypothetical protein
MSGTVAPRRQATIVPRREGRVRVIARHRNVASRRDADADTGRKDEPILYCAGPVLNPLRSEGEMFRLLLYVIVVFAVIIALVLILRAIF